MIYDTKKWTYTQYILHLHIGAKVMLKFIKLATKPLSPKSRLSMASDKLDQVNHEQRRSNVRLLSLQSLGLQYQSYHHD